MSIIKRIPMKTVRIQENKRSHKSLVDAKEAFLNKLRASLVKENTIAGAITRIERVQETKRSVDSSDIHLTFGYFDNFVRHVNDAHRHEKNAEKLQALIEATSSELQAMKEAKDDEPPTKDVSTLNIIFRNGIIKPTEPVANPDKYHWEMQPDVSCHQTAWSQIGATGDTDIRPNLSSGEVRLSYDDGDLVSNKIKLVTVIKRQAAAAKRRQYRYERDDQAFEQRCRGVAGRIQRMLKPGRLISDANFATRVFQDRVSKLPEHLDKSPAEIVALCESGTTDDDDYVHMIEFLEPTIYLNPRGLHDALTDIYKGKRIALRLPVGGSVEEEKSKDEEEDILERTRRQGILDRKRRQAERMKRATKLEAEKLKVEKRRAAAELERQSREEENRRRQIDREAEQARQRQLELERIELERLAELARITKEERQAEEKRQAELARIAEEQRLTAAKAAEEAAERERERKRLQSQAEIDAVKYPLPANFVGFIRTYASKKDGVSDIGPSEWFKAIDKIYTKSASGISTRGSTIEKANDAGWYEKSTLDAAAAKAAADALAAEEDRLTEEARIADEERKAERERLEQERLQKEAEATAERERLEQERLQKEAEATAERERVAKEAVEAEAARRQAQIDAVRSDDDAMEFLRYVFTTYDTNANGEIDELEIVKAYFTGQTKVKPGQGRVLIDENDKDGDGVINVDEFIDWCAVTGVMTDEAWKAGARDFKERQAVLAAAAVYKEFKYKNRWKRVLYQAPEGKTQGAGGNYYGVLDDGTLVSVKGKKNVKDPKPPSAGLMMLGVSDDEDLLPPKPGDLSAMIQTMSADWVSSDEELMDFAEASEGDSMEFAASSSLDTDSDLDFAQSSERSAHPLSSEGEESSEKGKTSSGMEFAESSAAETDSDVEFAESSDKTSSGLEFAESSAVESD